MNDSVPTNSDSPTRWKAPHFAAGAVILVVGVLSGRALFPLVVEKPLIVEKRVDIPVERIVEKRVEVPVEKIVYLSERAKGGTGAEAFLISPQKLAMWKQIKVGMTRKEVTDILGAPSSVDGDISINPKTGERSIMWEWRTDGIRGGVWFAFGGDGRAVSVVIPER